MAANVPRHKVFISYYHKDDQEYKNRLIQALDSRFVDKSVRETFETRDFISMRYVAGFATTT